MQVDDGAKAAPETILNDGEDWLTIIEGSLHVIPQDHWGIGATIKVRLDGDNLIISADEPGYSESTSVRIPALTTRPEPDAERVERAAEAIRDEHWGEMKPIMEAWSDLDAKSRRKYLDMARAALQAAAVEPEPGLSLDELMDIDAFASEFGDQLNDRLKLEWEFASFGMQAEIRQAIKMSLRVAIKDAVRQAKENGDG